MDGEEDDTSNVTVKEPRLEVEGGESSAAEEVRVVDLQCEPAPPNESVVDRLGSESSPPPATEFSGIVGDGDVVGGESREEPMDEVVENMEVENEVASEKEDGKDLVNEVGEIEKVAEEEQAVEESAAVEMVSDKGRFDDVTAQEVAKDTAPEGGDLADVAVEVKEAVPDEADLADVAAAIEAEDERVEAVVASVETEIISVKVDLVPAEDEGVEADVADLETEIISEKVDLVRAEETEMLSEERSLDEISPEKSGGLADPATANETETTSEEGGGAAVVDESEIAAEEGGSADVAAEDETEVVVMEEGGVAEEEETETPPEEVCLVADTTAPDETGVVVPEEGGGAMKEETETLPEEGCSSAAGVVVPEEGGVAMEEETETLPGEGGLAADVAAEDETEMVVSEEGGVAMEEETETLTEEGGLAADVAAEDKAGVVVLEEGGVAVEEETKILPEEGGLVADVAAKDDTEVVVLEEGGVAVEEETVTVPDEGGLADVAAEVNGGSPSEAVKEKEEEDDEEEEDPEEEEEAMKAEETDAAEAMEDDEAPEQEQEAGRGKRKRGKSVRAAPPRATPRKKTEEDVCFICFDGGELVLCDRRGCPKAYHPTCVNRDDAFFRSKGRWNCGWHLCSTCGKNAYYMCYTCTFSLCKACIKGSTILCVRGGNKGFCETCMKTVKLIEKNEGNMTDNVNFNDKSSWEYLFKDYYTDLKESLSLTLSEIAEAKNPRKGSDSQAHKQESADEPFEPTNEVGSDSDDSFGNLGSSNSKRKKARKRSKSRSKDSSRRKVASTSSEALSDDGNNEWASKELLEFVMHMRDGDASVLSQFDVQALLLEYIKRNKLRDPRRKSQIICDSRLENIFGKARVGHFEMLKLLESHFLIKEEARVDDVQGSVVDTESSQVEADGNSDTPGKSSRDKKRKSRRKSDAKGPQSNLDDYAAIDTHNINLIYLRRNLVEDLIDDVDSFYNQAVGAFVRIRIAGNNQKQDLYRLVQVVGTSKAAEPYKVGKKVTDVCLEILNLDKNETVSMDIISNQEFTEEECKRLRQSIKCGLINRLTVGDVQEKAIALQAVRVKDWLESEIVRLSHLRDRASETGRRKDLRECVEKLQLLKTSEERQRRLEEIPEIHTDPKMDPSFESEEEEDAENKRREKFMKARGFGRRGRDPISPRKSGSGSNDAWSGTRNYSNTSPELNRNLSSRGFSSKIEETTGFGEIVNDLWSNQARDREIQQPNTWDKHKLPTLDTGSRASQSAIASSEPFSPIVSETPPISISEPAAAKINESDKIWFYKDPSGKIQGPFSVVQLRKWNATGYFPADLRIWKQTETQNDSLLLADVLAGKIQKEKKIQVAQNLHPSPKIQVGVESWRPQNEGSSLGVKVAVAPPAPVEVPKIHSSDGWVSTNLPSPTPSQTPTAASLAAKVQPYESVQSKPEQILAPDIQSVVSNLQSLVQSVASHLPPAETQGWVKPEMTAAAPGGHGHGHHHWNNNNDAAAAPAPASFNAGAGFQSTAPPPQPNDHHWRPQLPGSQPNPGQPQNSGWGPPPPAVGGGWGGPQQPPPPPPQQNPNMNWGNTWGSAPPNQGSAPPAVSGWGPPPPMNANQGWQGPPPPGNNAGWNQGNWERGHNQDPGYGGKPWNNRQQPPPAFGGGGGSSRPPFRGQRVCKYHESGHCKKGSSCDYLHT